MRTTGIVRRIDDLGRVVIPKEVRYKLGIKDGEPLEIYVDDEMVGFKKYNLKGPIETALDRVADLLSDCEISASLSVEEKTLVKSMIDLLKSKWKDEE